MLSVEAALEAIRTSVEARGVEEIDLDAASGRVLARAVTSDVDWPPFDTSAMDGYAVRLADALPGRPVAERGVVVAAGSGLPEKIGPGEVVRIMTGAPLPAGTEAIVPVEQTARTSAGVVFDATPAAGAHIRRRGESVRRGTELLARGRRLGPADVALAALAGADPVAVFRAPRISVGATGDEIVRGRSEPAPGRLRDSNGPMLLSACRAAGWRARRMAAIPDRPAEVARLFDEAGASEDFLLTTGGVSAGDLDLLPGAARAAGFEILFHGVAMRPGKPVVFARRGGVFWIGLPGNPVSASVAFHLFAREALARFEGDAAPGLPRVRARLSAPLRGAGSRETYRDGIWSCGREGSRVAPMRSAGSHDLAAHARANAWIRLPPEGPPLEEGAEVECLLRESQPGSP